MNASQSFDWLEDFVLTTSLHQKPRFVWNLLWDNKSTISWGGFIPKNKHLDSFFQLTNLYGNCIVQLFFIHLLIIYLLLKNLERNANNTIITIQINNVFMIYIDN